MTREELKAEIEWEDKWLASAGYNAYNVSIAFDSIKHKIKALEQESEAEQFARWVATKIFSGMFEDDLVTFAELACRKLAKLGIIKADGDEWVVVEPQESEEEDE